MPDLRPLDLPMLKGSEFRRRPIQALQGRFGQILYHRDVSG
jgi:hypothetical protein